MVDDQSDLLTGVCIDVYPEVESRGSEVPPADTLKLALQTIKLWECGRVLNFHFLGGTEDQKQSVRINATKWTEYANLLMRFDQPIETSEFRVAFDRVGNWSTVGTDCLLRPAPQATMNIWNLSSILHEVGHAIGCIHEHSSPASAIQWNKPVVYQALAGEPNYWDQAKVDWNVFQKYNGNLTQFSAFDQDSVMLYFFPASWTLNGVGTNNNDRLSNTDKAFINRCYPGCTVDFSEREIATGGCTVTYGSGVFFERSWRMNHPGVSFIEVQFNQPKQYGGVDIYRTAKLKMRHQLTSLPGLAAKINSPIDPINDIIVNIDIIVNGNKVKEDDSLPSADFLNSEEWDITNYMNDGSNVIRLNFREDATTKYYWIQKLQVDCERILT
jgi:hypothetical protein